MFLVRPLRESELYSSGLATPPSLENTEDGESDEEQVDDDHRGCREPGLHHRWKAVLASTEAAQLFKVPEQCHGGHDHSPVDEHEIDETHERTVAAEIIEEKREGVVAEMHEDRTGEAVALPDEGEQRTGEECCQKLHQIPVHEPEEQRTDHNREELPIAPELIIDEPAEEALLDERRDDHRIQDHPEAGHPPARDLRCILHREALPVQKRLHRRQQDRAERL